MAGRPRPSPPCLVVRPSTTAPPAPRDPPPATRPRRPPPPIRLPRPPAYATPDKVVSASASPWSSSSTEREFARSYLKGIEYSGYDRLVQLCDALAQPPGFCLIEKRLVDVALPHGFNALTLAKWRAFLDL